MTTCAGHLNYLFYAGKLGVNAITEPRGSGHTNTVGCVQYCPMQRVLLSGSSCMELGCG